MSLAETEIANVESINKTKPEQRFGLTGLKQFARAGLDLKIGDFRAMAEELCKAGKFDSPHDVADSLFAWMTETLESDQPR